MSLFRRLASDRRGGGAALELALLTPFLVVLMAATAEFVAHVRSWYRLEQAAAAVANSGARLETVSTADVAGLFDAANAVAHPAAAWTTGSASPRARTLIGVVGGTPQGNRLAWVCSRGDAGLPAEIAGHAALPNDFRVPGGQTVLVVEVISTSGVWRLFFGSFAPAPIRTHVVVRPRVAQLATLTGGCPA